MNNYKPGGGNKPQPYIPAGNGEKSGEYKPKCLSISSFTKNKKGKFNFKNSKLVSNVINYSCCGENQNIPSRSKPNSVIKKVINCCVVTERYYDNDGKAYLDIDYTCHGRPSSHPEVPHIHKWKKDENGNLHRENWERFQWDQNVSKN